MKGIFSFHCNAHRSLPGPGLRYSIAPLDDGTTKIHSVNLAENDLSNGWCFPPFE